MYPPQLFFSATTKDWILGYLNLHSDVAGTLLRSYNLTADLYLRICKLYSALVEALEKKVFTHMALSLN